MELESASGIILFAAAVVAIGLDNSILSPYYEHFLEVPLSIQLGDFVLSKHLLHWVNDGLMVIFFMLVALEIKREVLEGELNSLSKVILPAAAALGGMIMPAMVFMLFNMNNEYAMRGWAIPTATDIAFSLGVISLLGSRVPLSLKMFLMALAIFDDVGAIIIIALFYNADIYFISLLIAVLCLIILFIFNRLKVENLIPYFLTGAIMWLAVLNSGVHATLAGVALAFAIPLTPAKRVAHIIHPWVGFLVLPLFAFMNAGVSLDDLPPGLSNLFSPTMLGISLGLLFGKFIGVFSVTFLVIKLGLAKMPSKSTWPQIFGISLVCGIGFTMSFFVGTLAYPVLGAAEPYDAWVRLGVLSGSLISGFLGYIVLSLTTQKLEP